MQSPSVPTTFLGPIEQDHGEAHHSINMSCSVREVDSGRKMPVRTRLYKPLHKLALLDALAGLRQGHLLNGTQGRRCVYSALNRSSEERLIDVQALHSSSIL